MTEDALRDQITSVARSLHDRGLTHGSTGNISARLAGDRWLVTPTGASFGSLDPARISLLDDEGALLAGDRPSKEAFLHRAMYRERPRAAAVVHLHATHSVAVSVLADVDPADVLPPLTAYYVMRIGSLPLVPYHPPGDPALADAVVGPEARPVVVALKVAAGPKAAAPSVESAALVVAPQGLSCGGGSVDGAGTQGMAGSPMPQGCPPELFAFGR